MLETLLPDHLDIRYYDESYFRKALAHKDFYSLDYNLSRTFNNPSYSTALIADIRKKRECMKLTSIKETSSLEEYISEVSMDLHSEYFDDLVSHVAEVQEGRYLPILACMIVISNSPFIIENETLRELVSQVYLFKDSKYKNGKYSHTDLHGFIGSPRKFRNRLDELRRIIKDFDNLYKTL